MTAKGRDLPVVTCEGGPVQKAVGKLRVARVMGVFRLREKLVGMPGDVQEAPRYPQSNSTTKVTRKSERIGEAGCEQWVVNSKTEGVAAF
jgi:hypothetical protein